MLVRYIINDVNMIFYIFVNSNNCFSLYQIVQPIMFEI